MQWPPCEQAPPVNWHRCRADNFYLTKKQLRDDSPSRQAGVPAATETQLRAFGCDRVQRGVLYLRLPQAVAATGQVLLHRFYCKKSLTEFDVKVSPRQPTKVSFFSLTPGRRCDAPPPPQVCSSQSYWQQEASFQTVGGQGASSLPTPCAATRRPKKPVPLRCL